MSLAQLETWIQLLHDDLQPLRDTAASIDPRDVSAVARLRRSHPAPLVTAALDLAIARSKAGRKWPGRADRLVADAQGVEQASSASVAAHKAARYRNHLRPGDSVIDLCCGIGGDAMALRDAGLGVLAIDRDPLRAWMTHRNARCPAVCADVAALPLRDQVFHIDPARRGSHKGGRQTGGRIFRLADYQPGPPVIRDLLRRCADGGVKLSPAIDLDELARHELDGEIEFISDAGRLVQAMLWTGRLRRAPRTATRLDLGRSTTLSGDPNPPPIGPMRRYLFAVDPAAERAELLGILCERLEVHAVHPQLGLLTADHIIGSPWLTPFELLAELPWRPNNSRKVKQWLAAHDAGIVEVKTRGKAVDPDRVQLDLRGQGATPFTLFILRWDQRLVALIARRLT